LSKQRGKVTEKYIQNWFEETEKYLEEHVEILRSGDGNCVWNMDETSFYLNDVGSLVIAETEKPALQVGPNNKENLTVLISVNADGEVAVPFAMFAYKQFPTDKVFKLIPEGWSYGKSDSGWMISAVFYEFIANFFLPVSSVGEHKISCNRISQQSQDSLQSTFIDLLQKAWHNHRMSASQYNSFPPGFRCCFLSFLESPLE